MVLSVLTTCSSIYIMFPTVRAFFQEIASYTRISNDLDLRGPRFLALMHASDWLLRNIFSLESLNPLNPQGDGMNKVVNLKDPRYEDLTI